MGTLNIHCQWEDETVRERTPRAFTWLRKMKLLTYLWESWLQLLQSGFMDHLIALLLLLKKTRKALDDPGNSQ